MVALHPFFQVIDNRGEPLFAGFVIKLFRASIGHINQVACSFDDGHLHAKADAEIRHFAFTGELCGFDFTFGATLAKTARNQNSMEPLQMWRGVLMIKYFCVDPFHIHFNAIGHAAMGERFFDRLIGIFELGIFTDNGDFDLAFGIVHPVLYIDPFAQLRFGSR